MIVRDLKQWRKDSDNFIGSSEDRDLLFRELKKVRLTGGKRNG